MGKIELKRKKDCFRMKIIVGCEFSQIVTKAFRKGGHEAYSCDFLPCEGGHPEWHYQTDILKLLKNETFDLGIFHPPCTYLSISANRWIKDQLPRKSGILVGEDRRKAREEAIDFFLKLWNCNIPKICIENPIGIMSSVFQKPTQIIQPWQFGHGETKATCLWLKGLPKLTPSNIVKGRDPRIWKIPPGINRGKIRSITYLGIAEAMSAQWY